MSKYRYQHYRTDIIELAKYARKVAGGESLTMEEIHKRAELKNRTDDYRETKSYWIHTNLGRFKSSIKSRTLRIRNFWAGN